MQRRTLSRLLAVTQYLLIVGGVTLLGAFGYTRIDAHLGQSRALAEFDRAVIAASAAGQVSTAGKYDVVSTGAADDGAAEPDMSLWSPKRITAYAESLRAVRDAPLGVLSIDRFGLRVAVFPGTSEVTLDRGLGHIEGTASLAETSGNVGIAGHRDGFFRELEGIAVGDAIDLRSVTGAVRYRVSEILIVDPEDVYVLDPTTDATLTLVTCYPFYFVGHAPQRFIVKATAEAGPATALNGS